MTEMTVQITLDAKLMKKLSAVADEEALGVDKLIVRLLRSSLQIEAEPSIPFIDDDVSTDVQRLAKLKEHD